ncbi:hypothetical protein Ciccas_000553 [Cichlidogyrus casuarinus]|uniref:ABC transmembrane type-1 domain-containing protein n=1 Tax=Cichlidogyrus casuarinus TaxID=1844966 RepID=A0ABD2QML9_9PLAT
MLVSILILIFKGFFLGYAAEGLVKRMRIKLFNAYLNQEIGWFDSPGNQAGVLVAKLASDVDNIGEVSGPSLGVMLQGISTKQIRNVGGQQGFIGEQIAQESISSIRTVYGLGLEGHFEKLFYKSCSKV